jgi:hypothetical protein
MIVSNLLGDNAYIPSFGLAGNFARLSIRISRRHSDSIVSIHPIPEFIRLIERSVVRCHGPYGRVGPERRFTMVVD